MIIKNIVKFKFKNQLIRQPKKFFSKHADRRLILGIETSCDDTAIAVVDNQRNIISEVCTSQTSIHVSNGGIIPPVARDLHKSVIDKCVRNCLENDRIHPSQLTAIAVTNRPGLPLSLLVGLNYAKKLSAKYRLPVIPVNHLEAHALTAMLEYPELQFPFVSLLISGGNCIICLVNSVEDFLLMGQTVDDAPGDLLDKAARSMKLKNLGSPFDRISGGQSIEMFAKDGDPFAYFSNVHSYPLYSNRVRTCNFSFSGFLYAIQQKIAELETKNQLRPDEILPETSDLCASILYVLSFIMIKRLQRAFQYLDEKQLLPSVDNNDDDQSDDRWINNQRRRLVISGGCAANQFIIRMIRNYCESNSIELFVPSPKLCTDNGVMIAWNGQLKLMMMEQQQMISYDEAFIQSLEIDSKAKLGRDISMDVTMANIKCERLNVKGFVNFLRSESINQRRN